MKQLNTPGGTPPVGTPPPIAPGRPLRPSRSKALVPIAVLVLVVVTAFNLLTHRENKYERLADEITRAVAANDMRPVEKDFNAIRRPQLEDRAKVGGLSDFVNAEGKLKSVKEQPLTDGKTGEHRFIATFEKGQRAEDLTVDADGKVVDFHVRSSEAK